MPMANFHAARVRNPGDFQQDSFRNKELPKSEGGKGGVIIVIGRLKGETKTTTQAYRFPADKYTPAEARAWLKENDVKYISFEEATGEKEAVDHLSEVIRKEGNKWVLYSADGSKKLGEFDTEEEAKKREREIQAFKHMEAIYHEVTIQPRAAEAEGAQFEGREWDITIIGAESPEDVITIEGRQYLKSKNGRLYLLDALEKSTPSWEGIPVYDNHLTDEEFHERAGMRSVAKEMIGVVTEPRWIGKPLPAINAVLKIIDKNVAEKIKAAWDAGVIRKAKKAFGLSVDTFPTYGQEAVLEGRAWPTIEGFGEIVSTDLVAKPAAGGGFNRLIAAQTQQEAIDMTEEEVRELIANALKESLPGAVTETLAAQRQEEAEAQEASAEAEEATEAEEEQAEEAQEEAQAEEAQGDRREIEALRREVALERCARLLDRKLDAAKLDETHRHVIEAIFEGRIFKESDLDRAIEAQRKAQAAQDGSGQVAGTGQASRTQVGLNEYDIAELDFMRLAMGLTDFRGLESIADDFVKERVTESYKAWQKVGRPSNIAHGRPIYRFSEWVYELLGGNPLIDDRAYEAITTSGMSSIVKNAVNIMLAADYSKRDRWWEPIVTTEEVETIDQATLVRVYGMNALDVVNEGQAYTELGWVDQEETAAFVKKGNYVGVTLESLLRDKVNVIRRLPQRLSMSWYNTISDLVSGVFTVNSNTGPAMSGDGTSAALFNATAVTTQGGHANLLTTALSYTAYGSARTALRKQTDQYSGGGTEVGRRMLISPKYLLVPVDLESTARPIIDTEFKPGSANNDRNPYYNEAQVVVVPPWTDVTDWALVGDPMEFPAIWLIFLRGQRVPQIFTAGDESSGAMFTNDTLRYKVRMMTWRFSSTYDCAPVSDWRPLHKSNVSG